MPEKELYAHRLAKLEEDVKILYSKANGFAVAGAEMNTKLDSVLVTLGELKESIRTVHARPSRLWDKLVYGVLSAFGTAIAAAVLWAMN